MEAAKYLGVSFAFISGIGCLKYFEYEKQRGFGIEGIRLFNLVIDSFVFFVDFRIYGQYNDYIESSSRLFIPLLPRP